MENSKFQVHKEKRCQTKKSLRWNHQITGEKAKWHKGGNCRHFHLF